MKNLNDILTWKKGFGLLPIHLMPSHKEEKSVILLNGGYGDFCLNIEIDEKSPEDYYSLSWSSNTKNFVVINGEVVNIYNWKKDRLESPTVKQVEENFDKFYKYLLDNSLKSERDVVPFVIDIFRQFRNLTRERTDAVEALNLLFILLAGLEDNVDQINFHKWGLSPIEIPKSFNVYTDRLKEGMSNIKPKLDLILRHTSGILFQEAQKEVLIFDGQMDLWGAYSSKLNSQKSFYSSVHYTPPYLSRTIVENAIREIDINKPFLKIFDPACGSSEFLIEALKQLKENNYRGTIQLIGWDSSQTAINTSNFLLNYEKRTIWQNQLNFEIKVVQDSLKENWDDNYDIILMNPPFVSWEQMESKSREAVREVLNSSLLGKPNQASAFFYKSILSLSNNGVIGCVIPSSILTLDAYQKMRNEIYEQISIRLIGKLGNFVFEDALTDASFIIGTKPKTNCIPFVLWTKNEKGIVQNSLRDLRKMHYSNSSEVNERDYSIYQPITFPINKESWKPISLKENELYKTIERFVVEKKLVRIQDIFNVQQGIRTGNNNAFKISEREFSELPDSEKKYFKPVGDNESIKNGEIIRKNYVWYPYDEEKILFNTEAELLAKIPFFYNSKLIKYRDALINRARKDESNWWHLSEHRAWLRRREPRLVSSEFGKSDSFAFDKEGDFVVERGNAWLPKKAFRSADYYYFYLALFSCPFFDQLLSIYSKQLAGGNWYDLGKKFTGEIPIPIIKRGKNTDEESSILNDESPIFSTLVQLGKEISQGSLIDKYQVDLIIQKYLYNIK